MKAHSQHTVLVSYFVSAAGMEVVVRAPGRYRPDPAPRTGNPKRTARPSASSHQRGVHRTLPCRVHGPRRLSHSRSPAKVDGSAARGWAALLCRGCPARAPLPGPRHTTGLAVPVGGWGKLSDPRLGCSQTPAPGGCRAGGPGDAVVGGREGRGRRRRSWRAAEAGRSLAHHAGV